MTEHDHSPAVTILDDAAAASEEAARVIAATLRDRPDAVLGLATGGTMVPVYASLARMIAAGGIALARARSFNLDEYVGLPPDHPQSYRHFMNTHFATPTGMDPARMDLPSGIAPDPQAEAARYEAALASGGPVDLQLLGLGGNGHIGFNEPGSSAESRTRVVTLDPRTVKDNARFFGPGEEVPARAITMGIASILAARRILLVATGPGKAAAVRAMLRGPVGPDCPASFLRRHLAVTVILDRAAAADLTP
ncbi:MAG: glucosamine-6-phosphate deaminase [Rubellimicrobium sp.]|nr:glucosamine-6-phosphate deaminase [Rubellimicrobium sp.]